MKCIKDTETGLISRVHDDIATMSIKEYPDRVVYVPKSEWKAARRGAAEAKLREEQSKRDTAKKKATDAREVKKLAKEQKYVKRSKDRR